MRDGSLFGLLMCSIAATVFSADIFVSPTGDDAAAGTKEAPLATIAKARDKADELKAAGPVTVNLRKGTYYLSAPIVFGPANSGTATSPIVYQSYPGEAAVISGGIKLPATTAWAAATLNGKNVQKTTIEKNLHVDQFFLNGRRQIMARYPDFNANTKILNGYAANAIAKVASCANPAEGPGYIRALHTGQWGGNDYYITGKTGNDRQWVGDNNRGGAPNGELQMIENIIELLDAPGEWFYRKSSGELWFYPPTGVDMGTATVELAAVTELIKFVGTSGTSATSVKNITFNNITFTQTYRSLFDGTGQFFEKITGSDWGIVRKGTVFMQNAEEITILHCFFDQVGGNAVFMSGYNRHNVVKNTVFKNTGASCVGLFGLRSSIRCPESWNDAGNALNGTCPGNDRTPGPLTQDYPSRCVIDNNLMDTLGIFEKQVSGVVCSATEFDTIRHNTMCHMPRAGINYCDGCWGGNLVEGNWVYDCVRETSDHGPFNAWGRDRNMFYGQNDVAASLLDPRNPTVVRMNRFEAPNMFGIDLDDQATNYYQEKNLIIGGGFKLQWTRYNSYINNITITSSGDGNVQFHGVWGSASAPSHHYGTRNIIYREKESCVYQFCCGSNPTQVKATQTVWDSNMVFSPAGTPKCSDWSNCNSGNFTWQQWQAAGNDAHSVIANPTWVNDKKTWPGRKPEYLPVGDYNPTNTSAINAIKFQTFPMDSFGIVGTVPGLLTGPVAAQEPPRQTRGVERAGLDKAVAIRYDARSLTVTHQGDYKVAITSMAGQAITAYNGNGCTSYALDRTMVGSGLYIAVVTTQNGITKQRFVVNK